MKRFFTWLASWGLGGVFGLAVVESLGIPNPGGTDVAVVAMSIARPEDALLIAMVAALGSIVGSAVFFEILRKGGEKLMGQYTSSGRGQRFKGWFLRYGLVTVFITALLPVPVMPFKVFAACAGALGVRRGRFLAVLALARLPRYTGLALLGARLGEESTGWIRAHIWQMGVSAIVLFILLYMLVRWSDRQRLAEA